MLSCPADQESTDGQEPSTGFGPVQPLWHWPPPQCRMLLGAPAFVTVYLHRTWLYQLHTQSLSKHSCTAVDPADCPLKAKHPGLAQEVIQASTASLVQAQGLPHHYHYKSSHFPFPPGVTRLTAFKTAQGHG